MAQLQNAFSTKVYEVMDKYPLISLTQLTNYFQEQYRYKIHDLEDFKNMLRVYRSRYWAKNGKPYAPNKKDLEATRRSYNIRLFPNEFTPDPEVVVDKIIEKERSEIERLKSITLALQSHRY